MKEITHDLTHDLTLCHSIEFRVLGIYNFALLLVFHQDSFQKSWSGSDPPRYMALSSILQLFREISRKNHNSIYTHFQNQFPNLFLDHFRSCPSASSGIFNSFKNKIKTTLQMFTARGLQGYQGVFLQYLQGKPYDIGFPCRCCKKKPLITL